MSWILSCVIANHSHLKHPEICSESCLWRGCRDSSGPAALPAPPPRGFPKRGQRPELPPLGGSWASPSPQPVPGLCCPCALVAWLSPSPASLAGSSGVPPESCVAGEGGIGRSDGLVPGPPQAALPRGAVAQTDLWGLHLPTSPGAAVRFNSCLQSALRPSGCRGGTQRENALLGAAPVAFAESDRVVGPHGKP